MSLTEFKKEAPLFSFLVRNGKKAAGQLFIITEKEDNSNTYSNNKVRFLTVVSRGGGKFCPPGKENELTFTFCVAAALFSKFYIKKIKWAVTLNG